MKRIIALIISLALAACLLSACGDDETYRQPGNGTTLGGSITTAPIADDDNGSYSAGPDGDVSQTTDENILEDGVNDLEDGMDKAESGINQGLDDLEDSLDGSEDRDGAATGSSD